MANFNTRNILLLGLKGDAADKITFYVNSKKYIAIKGTTWEEFVDSNSEIVVQKTNDGDYVTDVRKRFSVRYGYGEKVVENVIDYIAGGEMVMRDVIDSSTGNVVHANDVINDGAEYESDEQ